MNKNREKLDIYYDNDEDEGESLPSRCDIL